MQFGTSATFTPRIDSISVVPDSFIPVKNHVAKAESRNSKMSPQVGA